MLFKLVTALTFSKKQKLIGEASIIIFFLIFFFSHHLQDLGASKCLKLAKINI